MFTLTRPRMLAGALTSSLVLAGGLAACGSDDTPSAMNPSSMMGDGSTTPDGKAPSADVAFVRQMIPHHQMAVQMAGLAQDDATHREIKDLADSIITTQNKEIEQLERIAQREGITATHHGADMTADATALGLDVDQMGMSMTMHDLTGADQFDRAFIDDMIPHHLGAVAMANAVLERGSDGEVKALARSIIAAQTKEIAQMKQWRAAWYGSSTPAPTSDADAREMGDMSDMHR